MELFEDEKPKSKSKKAKAEAAQPVAEDQGHYVVYARKWRPQKFDEVVGQESVSEALKNAISSGRISHAFLFTGPRGVGKTSSARILAKALNCLGADGTNDKPTGDPCGVCEQCTSISKGSNLDIIEIDAASNTGVDNIRDLRMAVNLAPFAGRYKVYIIDEVHMLSIGAFNALLKTLEEPPPRVVFILATTEHHKIPATIVSRCQNHEFKSISTGDMISRLDYILQQEGAKVKEDEKQAILETVAHFAEGGMRDAQVALDQAITLCDGELKLDDVRDMLGLVTHTFCAELIANVHGGNVEALLLQIDALVNQGRDLARIVKQTMQFTRDLLILKNTSPDSKLLNCPQDQLAEMAGLHGKVSTPFLLNLSKRLLDLDAQLKGPANPRYLIELAMIELAQVSGSIEVTDLLNEVQTLKQMLASGATAAPARGATQNFEAPEIIEAAVAPVQQVAIEDKSALWSSLLATLEWANAVFSSRFEKFQLLDVTDSRIEIGVPNVAGAKAMLAQVFEKPDKMQLMAETLQGITGKALQVKYSLIAVSDEAKTAPSEAVETPVNQKSSAAVKTETPIPQLTDEEQAEHDAKRLRMIQTYDDPDKRFRDLIKNYPDFKKQLKNALQLLGGGKVTRIDGVPLKEAIQNL